MSDVRTVSMPRELWDRIDGEVGDNGNRSRFIQRAVREYLDGEEIET